MGTKTERKGVSLWCLAGVAGALCLFVAGVGGPVWMAHIAAVGETEARQQEEENRRVALERAQRAMEVALAEHEAAILKSQQEREERRQREHEASRKALQEEYDNAVLLLREDMSRERERWR